MFVALGVVDQADVTAPILRSDRGTNLKGHVVVTARTLDLGARLENLRRRKEKFTLKLKEGFKIVQLRLDLWTHICALLL